MKGNTGFFTSLRNFLVERREKVSRNEYKQKKSIQEKNGKSSASQENILNDGWSTKKIVRFWVIGLLIVFVGYFSYKVLNIIFLIISAYIVSMIMESFISRMQKRLTRGLSIFLSYMVFLVIILGIFVVVIPFLYKQLSEAWSIGLGYLSDIQTRVSENGVYSTIINSERIPDNLKEYFVNVSSDQGMVTKIQDAVQSSINEVINIGKKSVGQFGLFLVNFISGFTGFLVDFLLFFVLCILFSVEKDIMTTFLARIGGNDQFELNRLKIQKIYGKLAVWFRSRLFISLLLALAMWLALVIMGWCGLVIPGKLGLALLAGLLDLIPYVGPILTGILLFVVCILYNPLWVALVTVLILWVVNVIENNVWAPLFMNKSLGVSAVLIFISMLIGGLIMGFFGVLLSVPIAVIVSIIVQDRHKLESDDLLQVDKEETDEANKELEKVKEQLKTVGHVKATPVSKK